MGSEDVREDVRARWYARDRKGLMAMGGILAIGGVVNLGLRVFDDDSSFWQIGIYVVQVVLGIGGFWIGQRRRVEADRRGLVVHRPPSRARVIPWGNIAEVRADVPGVWATTLVVVTTDDEVVSLPLEPTEHGPADIWRSETQGT